MLMVDLSAYAETSLQTMAKNQGVTPEAIAKQLIEKNLPQRVERPFDYDLDEIQQAIESGFVEIPKTAMQNFDNFENWLQGRFA